MCVCLAQDDSHPSPSDTANIALDWEEAFDRVSWAFYHLALKLLNFGPNFQTLAKALTSEDARPIRTIKTNGGRSYPFTVGSGMPQGCPLSPLTFFLTAEALTRAINGDEDIIGVGVELSTDII